MKKLLLLIVAVVGLAACKDGRGFGYAETGRGEFVRELKCSETGDVFTTRTPVIVVKKVPFEERDQIDGMVSRYRDVLMVLGDSNYIKPAGDHSFQIGPRLWIDGQTCVLKTEFDLHE